MKQIFQPVVRRGDFHGIEERLDKINVQIGELVRIVRIVVFCMSAAAAAHLAFRALGVC